MHVRTCRVTVPDLENGWTNCAQIWYTVGDRLAGCHAQVIGGTSAQYRTCKAHYPARSFGRPKRRYTCVNIFRYRQCPQVQQVLTIDIHTHRELRYFNTAGAGPAILSMNRHGASCNIISIKAQFPQAEKVMHTDM